MVTFALPGDSEVADGPSRGTPKPRAPLPFAQRSSYASPFGSAKRQTPQQASARRNLLNRDDAPSSSLNSRSIAAAQNIFRASAIVDDGPPSSTFSPNIPSSTKKMLFAPGSTPGPSRPHRDFNAHATPRGVATTKDMNKDLFPMRISSPAPELSGEYLSRKVPKEWSSKSSIYADQYLKHLCPTEFDDEQRRQFFCILDLRRLKYAADEVFVKKGWKLNIKNFANEFEKSRSLILLRYGLYEFQNIKPAKDILKRWRREHGLPDPEEEDAEPTPTKRVASKKRKAEEGVSGDISQSDASSNKAKRRATEQEESAPVPAAPVAAPAPMKTKRKASVTDDAEEQPSKMAKSTATPSKAKSLFEKAAAKPSAGNSTKAELPNPFAATKPTSAPLSRSVFLNLKAGTSTINSGAASPNIFGHLSDASSAKNSGVEADVESETDSESEEAEEAEEAPEAGQSDAPSAAPSLPAAASNPFGNSLFGKKTAAPSSPQKDAESASDAADSGSGRSLFDRVSKPTNGEPARAEPAADKPAPTDQTWNPSTTPIKFAPAASTASSTLFGKSTGPSTSLFGAKSGPTSNMFGASKPAETPAATKEKDADESDKENDAQASNKAAPESKPSTSQPLFSSPMFGKAPSAAEPAKDKEPAKPLFGSAAPAASTSTNLFGAPKIADAASTPPASQTSTFFGAKPAEPEKPAAAEPAKTEAKSSGLFGPGSEGASASANFLKEARVGGDATSIFSKVAAPAASKPLFGAPTVTSSASASTAPAAQSPTKPLFSFGSTANGTEAKPATAAPMASSTLFGAPKSPAPTAATNSIFSGSPMKQDDPSPAKRTFNTGAADGNSVPLFAASTPASGGLFGATSTTTTAGNNSGLNFGGPSTNANANANANAGSTNGGSGGFNFSFGGGGSSGGSFNNPFASGNTGSNNTANAAPSSGGAFNFGASSAPSTGGSSPFQFGGPSSNNTAAPAFGGTSAPGSTPTFSFAGASSEPAKVPGGVFASNPNPPFGNLQPPAGGASTTGTNSPFSFGGGSSLATTPANGTPEPSSQANGTGTGGEAAAGDEDGAEKQEQVDLTGGAEADEETLHEVRAKVLKFLPAGDKDEEEEKLKSKSPWSTQGVGSLRLLKHKETNAVRLLLRAEPRGHIAINRSVLPDRDYKADEKYVKLTTSNDTGDGLETWMLQVKTKDLAKQLAEALENNKTANKKA